jgi:hypothetical protein
LSNWAKLQEDTIGLPVFKRAKHGIHFKQADGQILANFVGKPCHFQDGGLWKPIDTKLLLGGDGFYGCPHSPVRISKEGRVKVDGTGYTQYTELPSATGLVDNDRIVRKFAFGEQRMWITEDGYRSEIQLNRIPTLAEARKVITSESGTLSKSYLKSLTTATDANGAVHTVTTLSAFRTWLASAVFPVVIDPDFAGASGSFTTTENVSPDWATARGNTVKHYLDNGTIGVYPGYYIYRTFAKFDTSTIGAGSTVTQVNLKLSIGSDGSTADFDINIIKQDWSAQDPIAAGNRDAAADNALTSTEDDSIWRNTNGINTNTLYTSGNLDTTYVKKDAATYYSLLNNLDYDGGSAPVSNDYVVFNTPTNATEGYRPVLTVTYTAGGAHLKVNMNAQMSNLTGGIHG